MNGTHQEIYGLTTMTKNREPGGETSKLETLLIPAVVNNTVRTQRSRAYWYKQAAAVAARIKINTSKY